MVDSITIHHIFTHDLRWQDNRALREAIKAVYSKTHTIVIQGWICIDPKQLDISQPYTGAPAAIAFLQGCLSILEDKKAALGTIQIFNGSVPELSKTILSENKGDDSIYISCAKHYTPFTKQRQDNLQKVWGDHFLCFDDHSLISPETLYNLKKKTQFVVYSPFYKLATTQRHNWSPKKTVGSVIKQKIVKPSVIKNNSKIVVDMLEQLKKTWKPRVIMRTSRNLGLQIIQRLKKNWSADTYEKNRNTVNWKTSMLARFLNTGVISIREVWKSLGSTMPGFERELVFRSFYDCRMFSTSNPKTFTITEFKSPKWTSIKTKKGAHYLELWKKGMTGVPIVDAAMRCLKETGWMHNRLRMVVASYLTRILLIDWHEGEKWFAKCLFDYNATQNHFGWKGQAALSKDSNEYWRVMNPYLQSTKYDTQCEFIHQWIPELKGVSPNIIHNWEHKYNTVKTTYPQPIIRNHKEAAQRSIQLWRDARQ